LGLVCPETSGYAWIKITGGVDNPIVASVVLWKLSPHPASPWGIVLYVFATLVLTVGAAFASYQLIERQYFSRKHEKITIPGTEHTVASVR